MQQTNNNMWSTNVLLEIIMNVKKKTCIQKRQKMTHKITFISQGTAEAYTE